MLVACAGHDRLIEFDGEVHGNFEPSISRDGRSCASCHIDGRDDGLSWRTPFGNRQTPMLAGRLTTTAPYAWNGAHATLDDALSSTLLRLGGLMGNKGLPGKDREALLAFVRQLPVPPQSRPEARELALGKSLFDDPKVGCASCHGGPALTDQKAHDVGSGGSFDTPSLLGAVGTNPYFHDGRHATLRDALVKTSGHMGAVAHLSEPELQAVLAYVESL